MTTLPILTIEDFIADPVAAAAFPEHTLRWRNDHAAAEVALNDLSDDQWIAHFGQFTPLPGNLPAPLALRYHGHQFGSYNPELGDGRGFLFAQLQDASGRWMDLGTKGSGQTPYSRFGDGRLTLKGAVRELLATEMLEALGVPTSRTFSIIETGESLHRGDEPSPTRSAVLVRLSHGHIRIGSFQRLAALQDGENMERLLRYVLGTLYARDDADDLPVDEAAALLVGLTAERCAGMAASWMVAGFVHGVLNTDNINVTGESFDYGPWRFTPTWNPQFTAAYFDHNSLYAFGRQAQIVHWDVGQLAVSLRAIAPAEPLIAALEGFAHAYEAALATQFCWRLGVTQRDAAADRAMILAAEGFMQKSGITIDRFFIDWAPGGTRDDAGHPELAAALRDALDGRAATREAWWNSVEPQSMHFDDSEAIWDPIATMDNWRLLYRKVEAVRAMGAALGRAPVAMANRSGKRTA